MQGSLVAPGRHAGCHPFANWRHVRHSDRDFTGGDAMRKLLLTGSVAMIAAFASTTAMAQDAAESAAVMAATGPSTANAQRSLGNAVSNSLNGAASVIRRSGAGGASPARRSNNGAVRVSRQGLPAGVDALEGTDASTYELSNGVTLKLSGRMNASAQARCVKECGGVTVEKRTQVSTRSPSQSTAETTPDE